MSASDSKFDGAPPQHRRGRHFWRGAVLGLALFLSAASTYLCYRAIRVMERAMDVMERVDQKVDRALAGAPAVIDRGKAVINSIDTQGVKEAARQEAKSLGQKAGGWLVKKAIGSPTTTATQPEAAEINSPANP